MAFMLVLGLQDVTKDIDVSLPVLFPPRPAEASAGGQPPPQQRLPQALVDAMADANAALLAAWAAKQANHGSNMATSVQGTLVRVRAWAPLHDATVSGVKHRGQQGGACHAPDRAQRAVVCLPARPTALHL